MPNLQLCVGNLNSSEGRSSGPRDDRTFPASTDNIGEGIQRVLQNIAKYGLPVHSGRTKYQVVYGKGGLPDGRCAFPPTAKPVGFHAHKLL